METALSNHSRSPLKILVVDDEPAIRSFAGALLAELGWLTLLADSGRAAVQLLLQDPAAIAAVLLDMNMPGMRPEETVRLMREIRPQLPVIILSGEPENVVRQRFGPGVIAGYISKPDLDLELELVLAQALASPRGVVPRPFTLTRLPDAEMDAMRHDYLVKCKLQLPMMTALLAAHDFTSLQVMGHTLKGSSGCFGFSELTQLGKTLEEYAGTADEAHCAQQMQILKNYLENT